jgi:hypothetical protein
MAGTKRLRRLLRTVDVTDLVVVRRSVGDPVQGFVVASGRRWILLRACHLTTLGSLVAIRVRDITDLVLDPAGVVVVAALSLRADAPEPVADARLDSTPELLEWADRRFGCITVFTEARWPPSRHVGIVERIDPSTKSLRLREIAPDATWWPKAFRWRFGELCRVELGDCYAADLLAVASARREAAC